MSRDTWHCQLLPLVKWQGWHLQNTTIYQQTQLVDEKRHLLSSNKAVPTNCRWPTGCHGCRTRTLGRVTSGAGNTLPFVHTSGAYKNCHLSNKGGATSKLPFVKRQKCYQQKTTMCQVTKVVPAKHPPLSSDKGIASRISPPDAGTCTNRPFDKGQKLVPAQHDHFTKDRNCTVSL